MRFTSLFLWPTLCLLLADLPPLRAEQLVVSRSTASRDYLQRRLVDGKRQPQTYVFMAGRYFAGLRHDNSLEKTPFRTIAERLALDLRSQDFHPAASLAKADLLLVVHWGVTTGNDRDTVALASSFENLANIGHESEQAQIALNEALAVGDLDGAGRARDNLESLSQETKSEYQTIRNSQKSVDEDSASLLGLGAELYQDERNPFGSERRKALVEMTQEERYFVIVMAYDAPTLVGARKLKRVWTLRASIDSAGVNFHQALDRIGNVAGHYFGTRQEGIAFDRTGDRRRKEHITLGDLIVIGAVDR